MAFNRYHLAVLFAGFPGIAHGATLRGSSLKTEQPAHVRNLQWLPNQDCYDNGGNVISCSEVQGNCNNAPACAATPQDADHFGRFFCIGFAYTVWNNEEPDCQWQYMCCKNPPGDSAIAVKSADSQMIVPAARATGTPTGPQQRKLQGGWLPQQTCYDDSGNSILCSKLQGHCNNMTHCAAFPQDAYNLARLSCKAFTVWNNEEPACPWQFMCCSEP
jgi:hypothetical protein